MRTDITAQLMELLKAEIGTIALCWCVEKNDGSFIRGTEHDKDLTILQGSPADDIAGTYFAGSNITGSDVTSNTDGSVDNSEVSGAFPSDDLVGVAIDVKVSDIEAGLFDYCPVTLFALNYLAPNDGYVILRRGTLGEISHTSDKAYTCELRGLVQALSQTIIQTFGDSCNVQRLGDARCKIDVNALTIDAAAAVVTDRKRFTVTGITDQGDGYFSAGILRGVIGANAGYEREVKRQVGGALELWDPMPADIDPGDTFRLEPGCDRTSATCINKFGNIVNFRGYGIFIPGALQLLAGPTTA